MKGSMLVVQVREANDIRGSPSAYVEVFFGEERRVTTMLPPSNRPLWNEKFTFDVITGKENILVNLCKNAFGGREIIGSCQYEIEKLKGPDYVFDDWGPIKNNAGSIVGQIKVSIQWIVSRVDFFNNLIKKLEKDISDNQAELAYDEGRLENIYGIIVI